MSNKIRSGQSWAGGGAREVTSRWDRPKALILRLAPYSVVWLVLSVGVSWAVSMGGWFVLILFAALTSVTYAYLELNLLKH